MTSADGMIRRPRKKKEFRWFKELWYAVSMATQLGFEIALPPVLLMMLGRWADGRLGTPPLLTLIGALSGLAVAYRSAVAMLDPIIKRNGHGR